MPADSRNDCKLCALSQFDDVRSAAAAALGSLHNYSPLIGEKLQDLISEKTDGVSLALMECAGKS